MLKLIIPSEEQFNHELKVALNLKSKQSRVGALLSIKKTYDNYLSSIENKVVRLSDNKSHNEICMRLDKLESLLYILINRPVNNDVNNNAVIKELKALLKKDQSDRSKSKSFDLICWGGKKEQLKLLFKELDENGYLNYKPSEINLLIESHFKLKKKNNKAIKFKKINWLKTNSALVHLFMQIYGVGIDKKTPVLDDNFYNNKFAFIARHFTRKGKTIKNKNLANSLYQDDDKNKSKYESLDYIVNKIFTL